MATAEQLGIDLDILTDMQKGFPLASGFKNLANDIARELMTPERFLADTIGDDADYGFDVRGRLNSEMTDAQIKSLGARIKKQCERDERVQEATVDATYTFATQTLNVVIDLLTAEGPFRLILGITSLTVEILNEGLTPAEAAAVSPAPVQIVLVKGDQGPAGAPGAAGAAGTGAVLDGDEGRFFATSSDSEEWLTEFEEDFDLMPGGSITAFLNGVVQALGGATGTFRLRVGGTSGAVDGTIAATITTTSATLEEKSATAAFTNPGGKKLIKVTGLTSVAGQDARIRGIEAGAR